METIELSDLAVATGGKGHPYTPYRPGWHHPNYGHGYPGWGPGGYRGYPGYSYGYGYGGFGYGGYGYRPRGWW